VKKNLVSKSNSETVKEIYAAINRNDIAGSLKYFDPQIVRIEPEGFATEGTYRGLDELKAHFTKGRSTWAEGFCKPEKIIVAGDKVVVFVYVKVTLKKDLQVVEGRFADGFIFKNGKAILMRSFAERSEALEWAGIEDEQSL
jgi:ketosteroid isomerase-like protein